MIIKPLLSLSGKPLQGFRGQRGRAPLIAVIAAAIGGLIAGLRMPLLLLPLIYVLKYKDKKDVFLLVFSVYVLATGYEFEVSNLYELDLVKVLSVVIPALLLLDSGLRSRLKEEKTSFYEFSKNKARRGVFAALISFSLLLAAIVLGQSVLNMEGGTATQVVFIAAVSTLVALVFFWRKRERVEFTPL
ncbi:MAG: hypothetical protein QMD22_02375 [archaeon]|nr:hypothetical protein [archaeon]